MGWGRHGGVGGWVGPGPKRGGHALGTPKNPPKMALKMAVSGNRTQDLRFGSHGVKKGQISGHKRADIEIRINALWRQGELHDHYAMPILGRNEWECLYRVQSYAAVFQFS